MFQWRILPLALLLWVLGGALAVAQSSRPVQAETPGQTVATFREAMDGINPKLASQILMANDPAGREKIMQLQQLADALGQLRAAIKAKFGDEAYYLKEKPGAMMPEKIDGDSAMVTTPEGKIVHLQRVEGKWRIPVRQENSDAIVAHLAELQVITEAIERIAADTEAGRFDTADEVLRAAQEELTRGREVHRAATRAATSP